MTATLPRPERIAAGIRLRPGSVIGAHSADTHTPGAHPRRNALIVAGIVLALAALYCTLSIQRHHQMLTTGYDLGIFEQEVRSYASGQWPTALLKGPNYSLLGDHFSPIVALIAPFYLLFPAAETLLVCQALLMALGVAPLTLWALRRFGWPTAAVTAGGYGLSWGLAQAVGFDFHEIAFAVPLLAFSLSALGQGRLRAAVIWAIPLIVVKEDLGLTLAMIGALVAWRGARRWGAAAVAVGVIATAVEMLVIIPAFNPAGANSYTGQVASSGILSDLLSILSPDTKIVTLVLLLAPTAFLALRSPLLLVAAPTLLWRFLSDNPFYWGTGFHYSAVLMPIVFAAFLEGLSRVRSPRLPWLLGSALVTVVLLGTTPLAQLTTRALWDAKPAVAVTRMVLEEIPDGATVSASNSLVPQLTARTEVSLFGMTPIAVSRPDYIIVNDDPISQFPIDSRQQAVLLADAESSDYTVVFSSEDLTLLKRR